MNTYLAAHKAFVEWLDGKAQCNPTPSQVEEELYGLAKCAATRGMTSDHWTFVIDGLIAHTKRRCPDNERLPGYVARGFALSDRWSAVTAAGASGSL